MHLTTKNYTKSKYTVWTDDVQEHIFPEDRRTFDELKISSGEPGGFRTHDTRIKSPVLYHWANGPPDSDYTPNTPLQSSCKWYF